MGLSNKEVMELVRDKFKNMEGHMNLIEKELKKDSDEEFNRSMVAMSFGKLYKNYEEISFLMGIYDNKPKYEGR